MPGNLTRTQKRQKETRERIFRIATELFAEKGFENTTVSDITEAADIGKGTFFTYFPTKEAIFRQPGEMAMANMSLAAQTGMSASLPLAKILKNVLTASVDWHEANKSITRQMSKSNFSMDITSPNKGNLMNLLARLIILGQKKGEFNSAISAQDAALVLAGTYFIVTAAWAISEDRTLRERMESSVDVVLKGLQSS
jgi:AcrR family transcriptional regulator